MKATKTTRAGADFVDVRRNGEGHVIYKCLKCDLTTESNAYYEPNYKAMINHAAQCDGKGVQAMEGKALVPSQSRQIVNGDDVKLLADRIKMCTPGGQKLTQGQALALAQVAISADLNPFIGELYYIPNIGPDAGIEGMRRKAKEQSGFSVDIRPMRADERELHGLTEADYGSICALYRHDVLREAVEINQMAGEAIIPIKPILGVGVWRKGDNIARTKTPQWMADKRAEKDAIRKAFDLGLNPPPNDDGGWAVVEGESSGKPVLSVWEEAEITRRVASIPAEREGATQTPPIDEEPAPIPDEPDDVDYGPIVGEYLAGEREIPEWLADIKKAIEADPKASEPIGTNWTGQVTQMALEYISFDAFKAFLRILFKKADYRPEEMTFGAVRVLKPIIADNGDFKERVEELLS